MIKWLIIGLIIGLLIGAFFGFTINNFVKTGSCINRNNPITAQTLCSIQGFETQEECESNGGEWKIICVAE
jgi:uncharacterized protein YneF (UPF0154 family)